MNKNVEIIPVRPDKLLKEMMMTRNWSIKDLAIKADLNEKHLRKILAGFYYHKHISECLGRAFGKSPDFFLNIQNNYRESAFKNLSKIIISIQPRFISRIAAGTKTLEIRKSCPKIKTPFKVYMYITKTHDFESRSILNPDKNILILPTGQIAGEFICTEIIPLDLYDLPKSEGRLGNRSISNIT